MATSRITYEKALLQIEYIIRESGISDLGNLKRASNLLGGYLDCSFVRGDRSVRLRVFPSRCGESDFTNTPGKLAIVMSFRAEVLSYAEAKKSSQLHSAVLKLVGELENLFGGDRTYNLGNPLEAA